MIDCVFRFSDLETFVGKLAELGVDTKPATDEGGNAYIIEQRAGVVMTPPLTASNGDMASCVRLTPEQAVLVPDITSPDFLCDWRSDEVEIVIEETEEGVVEVEQQLPWPEYEINVYDDEGNIIGTRMQGVGRIG